jgi:hypothetical protein
MINNWSKSKFKKPWKHYCQPHYYLKILTLFSKLHKNGKKSDRDFFSVYIIQEPLKDDFLQFCFSEKAFLEKNVRSGVSKKIVFLGGEFKPS